MFLSDGELDEHVLTYGDLDSWCRKVAGALQQDVEPGERVLIVAPPGREYLVAFVSCLYAGVVAVPCYPPNPLRLESSLERLATIVADTGAVAALTVKDALPLVKGGAGGTPQMKELRWLAVDDQAEGAEAAWQPQVPGAEQTAFVQYTSGSTSEPRGVMVTHRNVLANVAMIHSRVTQGPDSTSVLWLPPYHDMGLLNMVYALVSGFKCIAMSPLRFLQRPARWLEAVSRHRATYSGGPTFGYDLVARKVGEADMASLDLSSWEVAFCGAEPVTAASLDRFASTFEASGFRSEALFPCYGLAEFTVAVTGGRKLVAAPRDRVSQRRLAEGVAVAPEGDELVAEMVSCGTTEPDHELRVVDSQTGQPRPDGSIGEIWCRGPSRAAGYWGKSQLSAEVFEVRLADSDSSDGFLRTGDLGYLKDGELYITGRLKELVILRGRNYYPQDLERSAELADDAVRSGGIIAFSSNDQGTDRLVIVAEVTARDPGELEEVAHAVRRAVARDHEIAPFAVTLIAPRRLPKTASGKLQRGACRSKWLAGGFKPLFSWEDSSQAYSGLAEDLLPPVPGEGHEAIPGEVQTWLITRVGAVTARPLGPSAVGVPLTDLGLDSLRLVELTEDLGTWIGEGLPPTLVWDFPTIREIAGHVGVDPRTGQRAVLTEGAPISASSAADDSARHFYVPRSEEEDRDRTNVHYQLPARFFEVMTGGAWNTYSCNLWESLPEPVVTDPEHQTRAQERKLDVFAELLELQPGDRILDVGCGSGGPLLYLAKKYQIEGYGIALSENQLEVATQRAEREGLPCRFELRHWRDLDGSGRFDGILTDEVIVHFEDLAGFFRRCFQLLKDGRFLVNKELHFTHPQLGYGLDPYSSFVNDIYGGTGNYRSLADDLGMLTSAGFLVEDVRQVGSSNYLLTASSWYRNLRVREDEMIDLVGEDTLGRFLKYLTWVMVGPGGRSTGPPPLTLHFVKARRPPLAVRERWGIVPEGEAAAGSDTAGRSEVLSVLDDLEHLDDPTIRDGMGRGGGSSSGPE